MKSIKIAARPSTLALAQANCVRSLLLNLPVSLNISIVPVSTKGDGDKSNFLYQSGSVGLFTSEVEKAVLSRKADIAVHSYKDLPTAITPGLTVAAVPKREVAADVLIASAPAASIDDLPAGATVGTSSLRRIALLLSLRSDLKCVPLRGNVETRIKKLDAGKFDAIVVAQAGLIRLKLADRISAVLPPEQFIPAPAQGALAVQIRCEDTELAELVRQINDENSRITAQAERTVLENLHGGCSIPIGVWSQISRNKITIVAIVCDLEGKKCVKLSDTGHIDKARKIAEELAQKLLKAGGAQILSTFE